MNRVPFSLDLNDGLVTLSGHVSLDGDDLVIEARRAALDLIPIGRETFAIPAREIESVELEASLVKRQLVIRPFSARHLDGFPGDPVDEIRLPIARKHREAAEALARETRLRNLPR